MLETIKTGGLLPLVSTNSTLRNTFNGKSAAGDQRRDLLTFRKVGQEYECHVTHVCSTSVKQTHHSSAEAKNIF